MSLRQQKELDFYLKDFGKELNDERLKGITAQIAFATDFAKASSVKESFGGEPAQGLLKKLIRPSQYWGGLFVDGKRGRSREGEIRTKWRFREAERGE